MAKHEVTVYEHGEYRSVLTCEGGRVNAALGVDIEVDAGVDE